MAQTSKKISKEELTRRTHECIKVAGIPPGTKFDGTPIKQDSFAGFFYFIMNYCYLDDKETMQPILFKLWDSQKNILRKFIEAYRLIILKARQLGLTWMTAAYCLWLCLTRSSQLIVVISAKEDWAVEFLDRVKFMLDRLPEWMVPPVVKRTNEILTFRHYDKNGKPLDSTIKSLPTTEEGAQSKTPTLLVLDESAVNIYVKSIWAASKPGIDQAKGRIIIISNAIKNGKGWAWTRDIYSNAMKGLNDFTRIFMPWWDNPNRPKDFIEQQKNEGMDDNDISCHYPSNEMEAISPMSGSYFGDTLKRHTLTDEKGVVGRLEVGADGRPVFVEDENGYLEIWRMPYYLEKDWNGKAWEKRYAIGSDVSEGTGNTYSVGYVHDRFTDELVARIRSNKLDAGQWAVVLFHLSQFYYNAPGEFALICAERSGAGQTTVKDLASLRAKQYVKIAYDKIGRRVTKQIGWTESVNSKHELAGDLKTWFRTTTGTIKCPFLIEEASTFIDHGDGKIGHEHGKLDDCVIGAGCTIQASQSLGGPAKPKGESILVKQKIEDNLRKLDSASLIAHKEFLKIKEEALGQGDWGI